MELSDTDDVCRGAHYYMPATLRIRQCPNGFQSSCICNRF